MPIFFVVLWSTGFLGAKFGLPYADPFSFITLRLILVLAILGGAAVISRAPWPRDFRLWGHLAVVGALIHGGYLAGVFIAIRHGFPSGLVALVVGLQPVLTAVLAGAALGERIIPRQWLGFALGLSGVALVLSPRLTAVSADALDAVGMGFALMALLCITLGTLYQKRFCTKMDLRTGSVIQYGAALLVCAPWAIWVEGMAVQWTPSFIGALIWLAVVVSVGAISLLMVLIRQGEAARVAGLFYLVPPVTAIMAWLLFGEKLGWAGLGGMALVAMGVALVMRRA